MSDDLSEFHDVFFEEAEDLVETMEAELLELLNDASDPERINTIFRAAHSIKGGSATFGFAHIAGFTHVMETLMDEIREGSKTPTPDLVDLLLKSTDGVRAMIAAAKAKDSYDEAIIATLKSELEKRLGSGTDVPHTQDSPIPGAAKAASGTHWKIQFRPAADSFRTANDPLAILQELSKLGTLSSRALLDELPDLTQYRFDEQYLGWHLDLHTDCDEAAIHEIFDWLDETSVVAIERVTDASMAAGQSTAVATPVPVAQPAPALIAATIVAEAAAEPQTAPSAPSPIVSPVQDSAPARKNTDPDAKAKSSQNTSIRVGTEKIDKLINLVGELVITQSMLTEEGEKLPAELAESLKEGLAQLQRYTRELQESVMQIRMVPISTVFNRMPRMIHDLSAKLGKKVDLKMVGEQTELDKTVMESIGDPLNHLVRNAVDHGIEMPDVRREKGKSETGEILLSACHESGNIVIQITDNGGGINRDKVLAKGRAAGLVGADEILADAAIYDLLFQPGFSTADQVSDVSGRGVGMDVVRRNIQALGGSVEVSSIYGEGSIFTIRLPLTLAIVDGQIVKLGQHVFVIPLISIVESIQLDRKQVSSLAARGELYRLRDEYIPIVRLSQLFSLSDPSNQEQLMVVVESDQGKVGLLVDDLLAQQQVVIKSMESNFRKVDGIAGATILGNGRVALIMDINGVAALARTSRNGFGQAA
ncbi:MAG: chemotaxis protein CheA [Pseudomonadales bacterium]|nr:chemotaxis protein CheA [Pseudomonadales bacterium]MCP5185272.1 chemotaxis protein CheA [Pseudomonadales bacterium]